MRYEDIEKNLILKLTVEFSLEIIKYCSLLRELKHYIIANQLEKAGTSIGSNSFEAQNSESKADFIHKFKIAAKESNETFYWLVLCKRAENYPNCDHLFLLHEPIAKMLTSIISTSKNKT